MNDSKELLQKIAALRLRLDQAQGLVRTANESAETLAATSGDALAALEEKVQRGGWHNALLDGALRGMEPGEKPVLPSRLTMRSARLVQRARDLLQELKAIAEDPILQQNDHDALAETHRTTATMIDAVLRAVQAFPPSPSAQARLSEGMEAILNVVEERLATIKAGLRLRSQEADRIDRLADALRRLAAGQNVSMQSLEHLAGEVRTDARQGLPMRLLAQPKGDPARAAAAHGLNVAQVFARLIQEDATWQGREGEGLIAALVHDVGMAQLPAELVAHAGPLTEDQRRLVERHPQAGAQALAKLWPGGSWAIDVAADHHERLDGIGYPKGKREVQLGEEARLLAVCDVYAALAAARPWRPALESRTALTDTLLLADRGALDKQCAERLLRLAFYPAGSVVELDDGSVAVVLAPQVGAQALKHPARPIVTVVRAPFGQAPTGLRLLDLAGMPERSIVRGLPPHERRHVLGHRYPELV